MDRKSQAAGEHRDYREGSAEHAGIFDGADDAKQRPNFHLAGPKVGVMIEPEGSRPLSIRVREELASCPRRRRCNRTPRRPPPPPPTARAFITAMAMS